ncbi:hypothetical protein PF006_g18026 [Phytophthora fragariae]|uniref:Uncharacterized protein n=2 Tax=Phytophthora fragariae TaxID=53985 RepID=A0A6A3SP16_9STRA|nr:hypothetical protein PF006_g18026 [Phytophthora fragariae]
MARRETRSEAEAFLEQLEGPSVEERQRLAAERRSYAGQSGASYDGQRGASYDGQKWRQLCWAKAAPVKRGVKRVTSGADLICWTSTGHNYRGLALPAQTFSMRCPQLLGVPEEEEDAAEEQEDMAEEQEDAAEDEEGAEDDAGEDPTQEV